MGTIVQLEPWSGAAGSAATIANTGFENIIKTDTAATMPFVDTWKPRGKNALAMRGSTSPGYALGVIQPGTTSDAIAIDIPWSVEELPNAESPIISFHQASDARQFSLTGFASGALCVRDGGNAARWTGTGASPAGLMTLSSRRIIRLFFTRHATAGTFRVQIVNEADGTVVTNGDTGLRTAMNTGGTTISHIKIQSKGASASVIPVKYLFGVPRYDWAATDLLPLWTEPAPRQVWKYPVNGVLVDHQMQYLDPVTNQLVYL